MKKRTSLEKAIDLLKWLSQAQGGASAMEMAQALSINRTTVHRMLSSLVEEAMVIQHPENRRYFVGPETYHIGATYAHNDQWLTYAHYVLTEVAKKAEASVGFAKKEAGRIINVFEIEGNLPYRFSYKPGTYYPIHCGAYGKTVMAYHTPRQELERVVRQTKLEARTPYTITDPDALLAEYAKIRSQGFCISDEENLLGAYGIGVPIRNRKNQVVGSLAAAVIKETLTEASFQHILEELLVGAERIHRLMP